MKDEGKVKKTKPWTPRVNGAQSIIRRTNTDDLQEMLVDAQCTLTIGTNDGGVTYFCRAHDAESAFTASRFNLENAIIAAVRMFKVQKEG